MKKVKIALCALALGACARELPPCNPSQLNAITAECKLREGARGCLEDPERLCPDIVADCDRRIDALSDDEVCQ